MIDIEIRRPKFEDVEDLARFFRLAIRDTMAKEGLSHLVEEIKEEIKCKMVHVDEDLESNGEKRYFLIALDKEKIVGTIEYGPANELIIRFSDGKLKDIVEIGTVFVHPDYQHQGIGTLMLNRMFLTLKNRGIKEFCLDSGYTRAQKVWEKKFGEPDYLVKNFWSEGNDHMIWSRMISPS